MYEEVEKSRTLNQTIIDNVNEGIQLVSATGDTVLINRALCGIVNLLNLTTETSIPKRIGYSIFKNVVPNLMN